MRVVSLALLLGTAVFAADDPSPAQIDDIINKFAAKEAEFQQARDNYTYTQTSRIQELEEGGAVTGRWEITADITYDENHKRLEHVTRSPVSTLHNLILTPEDMEDLRSTQPFVLTTRDLPKYYVRYLGRETLDEIGCYVFAVKPKKMEQGQRYFSGQVWVDDRDLQIVKTYGRGVGIIKKNSDNQFPKFETYREQIDGKYWFPTYTIANDTLHFKDSDQRIRQTVRYEQYKQFKAETKIIFGDAVEDTKPQAPPQSPAPAPTRK